MSGLLLAVQFLSVLFALFFLAIAFMAGPVSLYFCEYIYRNNCTVQKLLFYL